MFAAGKIRTAAFLVAIITLQGCSLTYRDSPPYDGPYSRSRPEPRVLRLGILELDTESLPSTGSYYAYMFEWNQFSITNLEGMLADMYARGFDITDAWYHGPSRCGPPDENITTETVYHPTLVVHLSHPDEGMKRFHFRQIDHPHGLLCPYSLVVFTIASDSADSAAYR